MMLVQQNKHLKKEELEPKESNRNKVNDFEKTKNDESQDQTINESLILAQDKRWRRA